jgi:hypothetical protein
MTRIIAIIAALLIVFLLPLAASADGSEACTFYGTVTINNAGVADGTLITAVIDGDAYYTHTSTVLGYSTYSLTISAPDGKTYADGTKVTFKIGDRDTGDTATFKAGANLSVNLTTPTTSILSTRNIAVIAGSVFLILALAAAAYYILFRRRVLRIAGWPGVRGTVPSEEPLPAAAEGQPIYNRYVWDNAKLAWVENTAPVGPQPPMKQPFTSTVRTKVPVSDKARTGRKMEQDTLITPDSRRRAVVEKRSAVPPKETLPAAPQGEPINRYIWDNAKLAWVKNPALEGQQPSVKPLVKESITAKVRVSEKTGVVRKMEQGASTTTGSRKRGVVQQRAAVPPKEAPQASGEGETINRYVWDNAKLAWVENPALVQRQPPMKQSVKDGAKANVPPEV